MKKQKQTTLSFGKSTTTPLKRKRDEDEEETPKPKKSKETKLKITDDDSEEEIDHNEGIFTSHFGKKAKKKKDDGERWNFLRDVRDKNQRRPGEDGYDPSSLYIPSSAYSSLSPFEKQYWDIKKTHFDKVENSMNYTSRKQNLIHNSKRDDAFLANKLFGLKVTNRVNMSMAGFPESSLVRWAKQFTSLKYKIVVTEQVETVNSKDKRLAESKKKKDENIVNREVDRIMSIGTIVDSEILADDDAHYLLAIKEDQMSNQFGFTIVDCATSKFMIGFVEDDDGKTTLETLMNHIIPKEVLIEKGNLSKLTHTIIKAVNPLFTIRRPTDQFLEPDASREILSNYFDEKTLPAAISEMNDNDLVMSSLGATIHYLRELQIESSLLSLANFSIYNSSESSATMILDGQTLQNLEILKNNLDGSKKGTLLHLLDHCSTPMGKRLFKNWLCHPLKDIEKIKDRYAAINDIQANCEFENVENLLRELPDMERFISRIHAEARQERQAVFFDGEGDKKKIEMFSKTINGFKKSLKIIEELQFCVDNFESKSLRDLCSIRKGVFPDIITTVDHFERLFDIPSAIESGFVIPSSGTHPAHDTSCEVIKNLEKEAMEYLKKIQKDVKNSSVKYLIKENAKDNYLIEIPASVKNVPSYLQPKSSTKAVNRYTTPEIQKIAKNIEIERENRESIRKGVFKDFLKEFDSFAKDWIQAIKCVSMLDCLISLSKSSMLANETCKAEFISSVNPILNLEKMINPCIKIEQSFTVIPNDTVLGTNGIARCILLTGPNMGGKSTLLRQVCLAVIMAQLGAYVPAKSFQLTPVDRIFTRIGANDKIMSGQSTFMVELQETSTILKNATKNSLVILDELGRGTSTFDGYSIAYSVIRYLAEKIKCRALFSTHYFMLTEELASHPLIDLFQMGCRVDDSVVTFTYEYHAGVCDKSYGMNVAAMAQIPKEIIDKANDVSDAMESMNLNKTERVKNGGQLKESQLELYKKIVREIKKGVTKEELISLQEEVLKSFTYY